jgi:hypothetical protein
MLLRCCAVALPAVAAAPLPAVGFGGNGLQCMFHKVAGDGDLVIAVNVVHNDTCAKASSNAMFVQ